MSTRTRGKNYKPIEAFVALASFLHVEETGDSKREEELYEMCAEQYLKHIDLLVAGKEPILSPNAPVPWPKWPNDISLEDAKKRAERPNLVWSRGRETARDCRKYESILENVKQKHGGHFPTGWTSTDMIYYLKKTLWEAQEEARSKTIDLVHDENTPPGNTTGQPQKQVKQKRQMPQDWPGPVSFLAWQTFGYLGDKHHYICYSSDKGNGPLL